MSDYKCVYFFRGRERGGLQSSPAGMAASAGWKRHWAAPSAGCGELRGNSYGHTKGHFQGHTCWRAATEQGPARQQVHSQAYLSYPRLIDQMSEAGDQVFVSF